ALVSALEEAAKGVPATFIRVLPEFVTAKRPFQHAVIWGLKQAWDTASSRDTAVDWNSAWSRILGFFEELITPAEFWEEELPRNREFLPTRNWIVSAISEFIGSGTRNDDRTFPPDLLPRSWVQVRWERPVVVS